MADGSQQNPESTEAHRAHLESILKNHATVPGVVVSTDEEGCIHASVPMIDEPLFAFEDNTDVEGFYDACHDLGGLSLHLHIGTAGENYQAFYIDEFNVETPKDLAMFEFMLAIAKQIEKNTTIRASN